ncbi:MAG: hypothetical protein KDD33_13185 [Bdellovibrionales bacterium]|nr:hypothetical protein [Bdellovibrionales bacterium]
MNRPIEKLNYNFELPLIQKEVEEILNQVPLDSDQQVMLSCRPNSSAPNTEGKGSIYDKQNKKYIFQQSEFTEFNPNFRGGYLEKLWKEFPFSIGRFRIAVLPRHRCYSLHMDREPRFHIAVFTHERSFILFEKDPQWYHIPADGFLYKMETCYFHTAMNAGFDKRVHLLFDSLESYPESLLGQKGRFD